MPDIYNLFEAQPLTAVQCVLWSHHLSRYLSSARSSALAAVWERWEKPIMRPVLAIFSRLSPSLLLNAVEKSHDCT